MKKENQKEDKSRHFVADPEQQYLLKRRLLEAMSEGCPAVAFDCKIGPSEMIRDGENGYLAPAEDIPAMEEKILALLNDPELRRTFADNAKKISTEFSVQTFTEKWMKLLEQIL